jgi:hypothetical protein
VISRGGCLFVQLLGLAIWNAIGDLQMVGLKEIYGLCPWVLK